MPVTRLPSAAFNGGIERAHEERAGDAGAFQRLADDAAPQVVGVHLDVGQLGHGLDWV